MAVAMVVLQHEGACQVHAESDEADGDGLAVMNGRGVKEALHRLECHEEGHDPEDDGARVAPEDFDLAGAEREALVAPVPARHRVGEGRYHERRDMRAHVPAVG